MSETRPSRYDPTTDLVLERVADVPASIVWKAWSRPEHIKHWWAPAPLTTTVLRMDFRQGGVFETIMRSPDGKEYPSKVVYLEIVDGRRIVFTDILDEDLRPAMTPFFTGIISLEDLGSRTRYVATALHRSPDDRQTHEKMGFHDGWSTCLDQLVTYMQKLGTAGPTRPS